MELHFREPVRVPEMLFRHVSGVPINERVAVARAILILVPTLLTASCLGFGRSVIEIELKDRAPWIVTPTELGDANVAFRIVNAGSEPHQPVVIRTDIPPGELPVMDGRVDLANVHIYWPGEGEFSEWPPEQVDQLFDVVEPAGVIEGAPRALGEGNPGLGTYVVLCYLPGHYEQGEYGVFELTEDPA